MSKTIRTLLLTFEGVKISKTLRQKTVSFLAVEVTEVKYSFFILVFDPLAIFQNKLELNTFQSSWCALAIVSSRCITPHSHRQSLSPLQRQSQLGFQAQLLYITIMKVVHSFLQSLVSWLLLNASSHHQVEWKHFLILSFLSLSPVNVMAETNSINKNITVMTFQNFSCKLPSLLSFIFLVFQMKKND